VIERLRVIVRFMLAGELPEALVLLGVVRLALPGLRFSLRPRLRHRTGASTVQAPYMRPPAAMI
jgi:hypothetical protein